jgi:hypothetical protein
VLRRLHQLLLQITDAVGLGEHAPNRDVKLEVKILSGFRVHLLALLPFTGGASKRARQNEKGTAFPWKSSPQDFFPAQVARK